MNGRNRNIFPFILIFLFGLFLTNAGCKTVFREGFSHQLRKDREEGLISEGQYWEQRKMKKEIFREDWKGESR